MKKVIALLLLMVTSVWSQNTDWEREFAAANTLYAAGKYEEAATKYSALEQTGAQAEALFFNMGNVYYQLKQTAPAIYYYEKTLLLNPDHAAAKANLQFAQQSLEGKITKIEKLTTQDIVHHSFKAFNYNQWAWIATACAFLIFICFSTYYMVASATLKRLFFAAQFLGLGLGLIALYGAYSEKKYAEEYRPGIVFQTNAALKEEPKQSAKNIETLQEGTKVFILKNKGLWCLVKLENQETGWLLQADFRALK